MSANLADTLSSGRYTTSPAEQNNGDQIMPDRQDHVTKRLLAVLDATPSVRDALDRNPLVSEFARNKRARDEESAAELGNTPRETIQTMRRIIGEGPGWVNRLREVIGKCLPPASLAPLLLPLVERGADRDAS